MEKELKAQFEAVETPFYHYDLKVLKETLQQAKVSADKRNFKVHFAYKANFNPRVLALINAAGFGADCVSGNEVAKAVEIGVPAEKITFAGVGKSDKEITYALDQSIFAFNVESVEELEVIGELAKAQDKVAKVALRINPNVDAKTHHFITTGLNENKFGILPNNMLTCIELIKENPYLELHGLHFHIGSQITDMSVFKNLCVKVNEWNQWFEDRGIFLKTLNVGGGLGVDYLLPDLHPIPDFEAYFSVFERFLEQRPHQEIHFELGRALVAQCGSLISKVLYVKKGLAKKFAVLDAGMTELMRPALYQAYHSIENLSKTEGQKFNYDVVGPICESSDCFGKEVLLPEVKRGDLIAIRTAGAYGETMASRYNLRDEIRYCYTE